MNDNQIEQLPFLQQVLYYLDNPSKDNGQGEYYYEKARELSLNNTTDILSDYEYKENLKPLIPAKNTPKVQLRTIADFIQERKAMNNGYMFVPKNIVYAAIPAENIVQFPPELKRYKNGNITIEELLKQPYYVFPPVSLTENNNGEIEEEEDTYTDYRYSGDTDPQTIKQLRKELAKAISK